MNVARLELLRQAAEGLDYVDLTEFSQGELGCRVTLTLYDQSASLYELRVQDRAAAGVAVSERVPGTRLPKACPDRHINGDSTFCLGFRDIQDEPPSDEPEAKHWWALLHGFLLLQEDAALRGRWPERYSWRHGGAARWQLELEKLECGSDPRLVAAVQDRSVQLAPGKRQRIAGRRHPCPCGGGTRILDCHEKTLWTLLKLKDCMDRAEEEFWDAWRHPCCETMKSCRLSRRSG